MALINNLRLVLIKNLPIKKILNQAKNCESPSVNLLKEQKTYCPNMARSKFFSKIKTLSNKLFYYASKNNFLIFFN